MATKARLTAEDLWQMPDDGVPRELVNGEIIEMPLPAPPHGRLVSLISYYLVDHVKEHGGGEVVAGDVRLILNLSYDPERVRGADVAFISTERLPGGKLPEKFLPGAPDLVVEVLSPSNTSIEIQQRFAIFSKPGRALSGSSRIRPGAPLSIERTERRACCEKTMSWTERTCSRA